MNFLIKTSHKLNLKYIFLLFFTIIGIEMKGQIGSHPWENPMVNRINEEDWRAWFIPLSAKEQVFFKEEESKWYKSLNGKWRFKWSSDFDQRPKDFHLTTYDYSNWEQIQVPMSWEMGGYGNPVFKNMGFMADPNELPKIKPLHSKGREVGSYIREFFLPESWKEREIYINFLGVESAFWIWINGHKVGYSEDSRTTSEFRITPYLKPGKNIISVEVYRLSDGVFLEDWDAWRMSGICRDVVLLAKHKTHIRDFTIKTGLGDDFKTARVKVNTEILLIDSSSSSPTKIKLTLYDGEKKEVGDVTSLVTGLDTDFSLPIKNPRLWSSEDPYLYFALIELFDDNSKVLDMVGTHVGFRKIEVKDKQLLINGEPLIVLGVNRVDHDPKYGKYVSEALQYKDIELMKKNNINTIRTAHCPSDPLMYELCDRYGLYVIDEANVESHGLGVNPSNKIANDPNWRLAHLERLEAMIERDKNYPSVIMWSLGNEAGSGANFYAMNELAHQLDSTRPTHYHVLEKKKNSDILGGFSRKVLNNQKIYGPTRYMSLDQLEYMAKWKDPRPYLMNEFAHSSGTALGNLKEYVELFEKYPKLIGGCIWDWVDQGIFKTTSNGKKYMACGYDFPNNTNANCNDGLLLADRSGFAKLAEVKAAFQRINFTLVSTSPFIIALKNKFLFSNLDEYYLSWTLLENGMKKETGKLMNINTPPGSKKEVPFIFEDVLEKDKEYVLNIRVHLKNKTLWADPDYIVAIADFSLTTWQPNIQWNVISKPIITRESGGKFIVSSGKNEWTFDKNSGLLQNLKHQGNIVLLEGPVPNFYRAPTQNDGNKKMGSYSASAKAWRNAGLNRQKLKLKSFNFHKLGDSIKISTKLNSTAINIDAGFEIELNYTIFLGGSAKVEYLVETFGKLPQNLPRIGLQMKVSQYYDSVKWYGRGPFSSYNDRKSGVLPGIYKHKAGED